MTGVGQLAVLLLAGTAAALAAIGRTKWLESHTLRKCVLLSVLLHAAAAVAFAALGDRRPASSGLADTGPITLLVVAAGEPGDGVGPATSGAAAAAAAENAVADDAAPADAPAAPLLAPQADAAPPPDLVPLLEPPLEPPPDDAARPAPPAPSSPDAVAADVPAAADRATADAAVGAPVTGARGPAAPGGHPVPEAYADRRGDRRAGAVAARGGSADTERAVRAALEWLAGAQSEDGRWDAARHGAGVERAVQGHHRSHAGLRGDHGVTGLALLAFLGAGSTHEDGPHARHVARGLTFLAERQRADGSLAGDAEFFAVLYCHGMASIAVAEAFAMSGDESLRPVLERAVRYSLAMQSPATGGWRYAAGDKGDTSQLGWQLMLLSSCRAAGLGGFEPAEVKAGEFLRTVSSGRAGGLAAYRPGERPTAAMTAEALFCRMLLGLPADHPAAAEGTGFLARSPPDRRQPDAYAWYYATLASFHVGGPQWESWNRQVQAALVPLQRRDSGPLDGSWDPDPVWGGHGGRVYATALAALTLEVYYRHRPLHGRGAVTAAAAGAAGAVGR